MHFPEGEAALTVSHRAHRGLTENTEGFRNFSVNSVVNNFSRPREWQAP